MKLADAEWQNRTGMAELLEALGAPEGFSRYVGGCVRDTLLGLEVNDVDLATRLQPEEVIERLKRAGIKAVPTGIAHGTVTAVVSGSPVEVTTLRRDVATDGRRATIAYTDNWREDAARRDFTINALSADPSSRELFDYFEGLADLQARRVRFIGDPLQRIAEDHLRILRFFRFHARFGEGRPDPAGLDACSARANDLMALSRERIADELLKMLGLPDPSPTIGLMVEHGIFTPVLPEIGQEGLQRLNQLIARERAAELAPDPLRRLAALLPADAAIAEAVGARLRLSRKALARLVSAAARTESDERPTALAYRIGYDQAVDRLLLSGKTLQEVAAMVKDIADWRRPRLPLSGGALIQMGLKPGPQVAMTLQAIEREWVERDFPRDPEAVRTLARALVDQALRESQ